MLTDKFSGPYMRTDLFAENFLPKFLANKLYEVQWIRTDKLVIISKLLNHSTEGI